MLQQQHTHLLAVHSVAEHADLEVRARDCGELEGARETLVALRVVVLQGNLWMSKSVTQEIMYHEFDEHQSV